MEHETVWEFLATPLKIQEGGWVRLTVQHPDPDDAPADTLEERPTFTLLVNDERAEMEGEIYDPDRGRMEARWDTTDLRPGPYNLVIEIDDPTDDDAVVRPVESAASELRAGGRRERDGQEDEIPQGIDIEVSYRPISRQETVLVTSRDRTRRARTSDQILWTIIRDRTDAIGFDPYDEFITGVMCDEQLLDDDERVPVGLKTPFTDVESYYLLKMATERFLMQEVGVFPAAALSPETVLDELFPEDGAGTEDEQRLRREKAALRRREEARRLGFPVTREALEQLREEYFADLLTTPVERNAVLPYLEVIRRKLADIPLKNHEVTPSNCYGVLPGRLAGPLALELIWNYWMEEAGLVQTLNLISYRFQNRRSPGRDALTRFDLDPLRPLSNLLWGYVQDEPHRLSVPRRAYEYDHQYGLRLVGKAVPQLDAADSRTKFLEGYHGLLHACSQLFLQDDDTTVIADGFPVMNALREVHLILAEGAHNQFGDLPSTARVEMLIQQWLVARPEIRDYLGSRVMVPYTERWMDRVEAMRSLQGWNGASITHFRDLAVHGEQLVLSIRYGNWNAVNDPDHAVNWARYWRPEIQRYVHAYRGVTGVDLTAGIDPRPPAVHLKRQQAAPPRRAAPTARP